jgi:hypothetical protein
MGQNRIARRAERFIAERRVPMWNRQPLESGGRARERASRSLAVADRLGQCARSFGHRASITRRAMPTRSDNGGAGMRAPTYAGTEPNRRTPLAP